MEAVVKEVHPRQAAEAAITVNEDMVINAHALDTTATKQIATDEVTIVGTLTEAVP